MNLSNTILIIWMQESPPSYEANPQSSNEINEEDLNRDKETQNNSTGLEQNIMNMISINGIIMAKYLDKQVGFLFFIIKWNNEAAN